MTDTTNKLEGAFNSFMPRPAKDGEFAITMSGQIAVRRKNGDYVIYNPETQTVENQLDIVFGEKEVSKMVILMPVRAEELKQGDIISTRNGMLYVTEYNVPRGVIHAINLSSGTNSTITPESNVIVKEKMCRKVVSLFNMATGGSTSAINPMMFMLMGENGGKDNDMFKTMMMMQMMSGGTTAATGGINPMMFMLMGDSDGGNDMFKTMMMMQMMSGANPFAGLANPATPTTTTPIVPASF